MNRFLLTLSIGFLAVLAAGGLSMVHAAADPSARRALAVLLAGGGVAVIPCDTIYGIVGYDFANEVSWLDITLLEKKSGRK